MTNPTRRMPAGSTIALTALGGLLAACAEPATDEVSPGDLVVGATDLREICPDRVVIQTDWNPQSEQGGLFNLLGPDPVVDAERKAVSGPLFASGEWTGVDVEIRAGGPAIGFTGVPAQMYTDDDILLGWVNTDEAVANAAGQPTTAVMATFEKAPWMIMWDPATYPEVETIADLGPTDATVRYFDGTTYMSYLVGSGLLREEQVDGSYDGTPGNFVAAGGEDAQQGFATVEPWVYENVLDSWQQPVDYQLVADTGYPIYAVALAARTADITAESDCLAALVPVVQQSTVDFFADPDEANALIVEAVEAYDTGWVYPEGEAENSTEQQVELGLVANAPDGTLGSFDSARLEEILGIVRPILEEQGVDVPEGLTAGDLATNDFLDATITLP